MGSQGQKNDLAASLPMYDFDEVRAQTDAFWQAIRNALIARGIPAPEALTRSGDIWSCWRNPCLLFSQTCGYPYVSRLRCGVTIIGTPDYGDVAGRPGWYSSVVICRLDDGRAHLSDFKGACFALNETNSQSGCHAMMYALLKETGGGRHFGSCLLTGSHAASAQAVLDGRADIAAIDSISWRFFEKYHPARHGLRVLMRTPATPGLPYITARTGNAGVIADAVEEAIEALPAMVRKALFIRGLWRSNDKDYDLILDRAKKARGVFCCHFGDGRQPG